MLATVSWRGFLAIVFVVLLPASIWLGMAGGRKMGLGSLFILMALEAAADSVGSCVRFLSEQSGRSIRRRPDGLPHEWAKGLPSSRHNRRGRNRGRSRPRHQSESALPNCRWRTSEEQLQCPGASWPQMNRMALATITCSEVCMSKCGRLDARSAC